MGGAVNKEHWPEGAISWDGHDNAIIGWAERPGMERVLVYDYDTIIWNLMNQGLTWQEAVEYTDHNIACLWAGEQTPVMFFRETTDDDVA
jgi:hypothetical protein